MKTTVREAEAKGDPFTGWVCPSGEDIPLGSLPRFTPGRQPQYSKSCIIEYEIFSRFLCVVLLGLCRNSGPRGKAEEEEARRIKQRIHEYNEASRRGIRSSTHIPIPNHPGLLHLLWQSAYESPIEELNYARSGKIEIEAMIQAAVEQTGDSRILYDIRSLQDTEGRPPISSLGIAEAA